jgi:hypothetical protein
MDFETDPFLHGRNVHPFACGLYNGSDFDSVWGKDCAARMVKRLAKLPPSIIYMHNGGRFDINFLRPWLQPEMRIINSRIVQCRLGEHEIRDSYAILPFPLRAYKKDDIEIEKLETGIRESNRVEILSYLRGDCVYLHELVTGFLAEFGDYLTIGSAAMAQLQKFHPFQHGGQMLDEKFRKSFFFGGRVQVLRPGVFSMPFKIYDVNSMYPYVMKNFMHPCGPQYSVDRDISKKSYFIVAEGSQSGPGAFPLRGKDGGISFTQERGEFACTIHEWQAALDTGYFHPTKVKRVYNFSESIYFDEFVDHFYTARFAAKKADDKARVLFYKLILNSAYGKFAQNPDNFFDWAITPFSVRMPSPWEPTTLAESQYTVWKKSISRHSYYHVCIGASIAGAARAVLMRALRHSTEPVYCDTDSIVCRKLSGVTLNDTELGAWKEEASGDRIAIAGKKMYACFNGEKCIKKATKGARLSAEEIVRVARGEEIVYKNAAPTFKVDGRVSFLVRKIRRTV